ncbi:MAG: GatB/YqeY domain-containing protein [Acidimicrobiia bacterium]
MSSLRTRIHDDLAQAMRDREMARVKVLRTTMSAIQNAEAVEGVASVEGVVGYGDVQRRSLTDDDVIEIIVREIEEFEGSVAEYRQVGQTERAEGLQMELEVLRGYLNSD